MIPLFDVGENVSLMPYSICKRLQVRNLKPITISIQLANRSMTYPMVILKVCPFKWGSLSYLVIFEVIKMEGDAQIAIILECPFLAIVKAITDMKNGKLSL